MIMGLQRFAVCSGGFQPPDINNLPSIPNGNRRLEATAT